MMGDPFDDWLTSDPDDCDLCEEHQAPRPCWICREHELERALESYWERRGRKKWTDGFGT